MYLPGTYMGFHPWSGTLHGVRGILTDANTKTTVTLDNDGATYTAFGGGLRSNNMVDSRAVIVIGPDGRIAATIPSFNQNDPMAYEALAEVIDRVTPEPDGL